MKTTYLFTVLVSFLFLACSTNDDAAVLTEQTIPGVTEAAFYQVNIEENIIYAEGLSHESLNSENYTTMPLKLDVYTPINDKINRPVFMFIHGGAFANGSKKTGSHRKHS